MHDGRERERERERARERESPREGKRVGEREIESGEKEGGEGARVTLHLRNTNSSAPEMGLRGKEEGAIQCATRVVGLEEVPCYAISGVEC